MPLRRRIILARRVGCSVALSYYLRRGLCLMDHSEVMFFRMIRCAARDSIPHLSPGSVLPIKLAALPRVRGFRGPPICPRRAGIAECVSTECYILRCNPRGYPDLFIKT